MLRKYSHKAALYTLFIFLISCEDRNPLPLADFYQYSNIRKIEVKASDLHHKLFVSPAIEISVNAYDIYGKMVALPDSLITMRINDEDFRGNRFSPSDTGVYVIKAIFGEIESAPVSIRVEDVINALEVNFSRPTFYHGEETEPIKVLVSVRDKDNNVLTLTDSSQLVVLLDGSPLAGKNIMPIQAGDYRIQARLKEHRSPLLVFKALNPNSVAKYIRPIAYSIGGTRFGIENRVSKFDLRAEVLDKDRNVLPFGKNIRFYSGGTELPGSTYEVSKAGTYPIVAKGYGIASEPLEIVIRSELTFPVEKLPVVFHFINQAAPSQEEMTGLISKISQAFRGKNTNTAYAQDPNAVDCFLEFELATKSPDGKILERPGVNLVTTERVSYKDEEIRRSREDNPLWNYYWHPNKYFNVWIVDVADASWSTRVPLSVTFGGGGEIPLTTMEGIWVNKTTNLDGHAMIRDLGYTFSLRVPFSTGPYGNDCSWDSDDCGDTPRYHREGAVINSNKRLSCEGVEFISTNYMDYGLPGVKNSFTYDQRVIIRRTLENGIWIPTIKNRNL